MRIVVATTAEQVGSAAPLYDHPVRPDAVARFLDDPTHHLLLALEEATTIGFVTGVETTHPDKGTEMLLYELAVDEAHRRRGVGSALVSALGDLARERGCYGMWVLTDADNTAALAVYRAAGADEASPAVMPTWTWSD